MNPTIHWNKEQPIDSPEETISAIITQIKMLGIEGYSVEGTNKQLLQYAQQLWEKGDTSYIVQELLHFCNYYKSYDLLTKFQAFLESVNKEIRPEKQKTEDKGHVNAAIPAQKIVGNL